MTALRVRVLLVALVAVAAGVSAQEGHPLAGTWYGEYDARGERHDLTLIIKWDGKVLTGTVNPGPSATPIRSAALDVTPGKPAPEGQDSTSGVPPVFRARIEFDTSGSAGSGRLVLDGTIQNPVAGNRQLTGTWTRGADRGTFQLRRL